MWMMGSMMAVLGLVALFYLGIALRVLLTERPLLMSSRILFAAVALCLLPSAVTGGWMSLRVSEHTMRSANLMIVVIQVVTLVFLWLAMSGWTAFGVTEDTLREALHAALGRLGLPFEERLSEVRLPSVGATLKVAVQGRVGNASLRIRGDRALGKRIVAAMAEHFAASKVPANRVTAAFYLIIGVLMLSATGAMAWAFVFHRP
jgi:hypothetical protein